MSDDGSDGFRSDPLSIRGRATPERVGVVDAATGEEWTYGDLDAAATAVEARLRATQDVTAPTMGLLLGTRPAVMPLAFGGVRAGARVGLLDVQLDEGSLTSRLDRLGPDLLICEAETEDDATSVAGCPVRTIDEPDSTAVSRLDPFTLANASPSDEGSLPERSGELVAFTSGTTGEPKGVRLPLETLVASAIGSALRLGVASNDRWLVPIPTYHVGGFSPFVRCALSGTTVVLQRTFDPTDAIATVEEMDVTCVSLVPTQLGRMLDVGWDPPATLRFALVGGGPVSASLVERCRDRGVPICPTYGATETASQVATARPETAFAHPGTVGRPLALTDVTLVSDGDRCDPGEVGEIVVDGPTVAPGYLDEFEESSTFAAGGFHTGDLGSLDAEGRLWIEGRVDDRIVTGGENVHATTVESVIESMDGVSGVAVVGIDDTDWGQRVAALVAVDSDVSPGDVSSHCRAHLPPYAVPKTITLTDELPRTPSGTIDRTAVERALD